MTEPTAPAPENSSKSTLYQPPVDGGLEAPSEQSGDYRDELRSRRWNAAPLENPEVEKTDPRIAVVALVLLGAVTLMVLVVGYGSGFWNLG